MRVFWISCLLIGSITCSPVGKDPGFFSGYGSNSAGTSFIQQPLYSTGYDGSAPGDYGSSASAYAADNSDWLVAAPQDENWSSGSATSYAAAADERPVFSDVSDLEPVYSFNSRSSYQRGRAVFAQTRYTPLEPVPPPMPVYEPMSKTPMKQSSPAQAPTKGGF